jgi:SAM-dependent methyltransferase
MSPIKLNVEGFPTDFNFYNDQFPPLDALTYWHFLKSAKRVVEVGCGYSTGLALNSGVVVTAIDPEPRILYSEIAYLIKPVQETDPTIFSELEADDILFIDSSHIYQDGSDVKFLIDSVLPSLKNGVLVQFHDFFGKDGYPPEWKLNTEMAKWNENEYILPLMDKMEVLAFNYEISKLHNEEMKSSYPFIPQNITQNMGAVRGASIWLKK